MRRDARGTHRLGRALGVACAAALTLPAMAGGAPPAWPDLSRPARGGGGERDAAVIVGIADYTALADIPGATRNASDWATYLVRGRGVPLGRVEVLRDADAVKEEILARVRRAASRAKRGGTLWFIYVGHGAPLHDSRGRDGLLVGWDAQQKVASLTTRGVAVQRELIPALAAGKQARTVVVLDACFSGRDGAGESLVRGAPMFAVPVSLSAGDDRTVILSAARSDQVAGALPGTDRPAFSYLVLGSLRGWADGAIDDRRDGRVTAEETAAYADLVLEKLVNDRHQTPPPPDGRREMVLAAGAKERGPDLLAIMAPRERGSWRPSAGVPVTIETTPPGAALLLGEEDRGRTPWSGLLPAGAVEVRASLAGYRSARKTVTLEMPAGGGRQTVRLTLAPNVGSLTVRSKPPGAKLLLDGRAVGAAPWHKEALNPGTHRVVARLAGYDDDDADVTIVAGQARSVTLRPSRAEGALQIDARRANGRALAATIVIDGREMGRTPRLLKLAAGAHRVELRDPGRDLAPVSQTVDVPVRETVQRVITFQRRAASATGVTARLSVAEGVITGAEGTLRGHVGLEAGIDVDLGWLRPELALAMTVEDPVAVMARPGVRWPLGAMYVRTGPQLMLTPLQGVGLLLGPGVEWAVGRSWRLVAEVDVSLWLTDTGVAQAVPLEGRVGVGHAF